MKPPPCVRIQKFRQQLGLTQAQLAAIVDMHPEEVCKLESGKRDPLALSVRLAMKVARALGKNLEEVFG